MILIEKSAEEEAFVVAISFVVSGQGSEPASSSDPQIYLWNLRVDWGLSLEWYFPPQCKLVASLFSHLCEAGRVVVFAVICRVRKVKLLAAGHVVGEN